jgi:hypothetical protein
MKSICFKGLNHWLLQRLNKKSPANHFPGLFKKINPGQTAVGPSGVFYVVALSIRMDASKAKKEAPKGSVTSKSEMLNHYQFS